MSVLPPYTEQRSGGGANHTFKHEDEDLRVHLVSQAVKHDSPPLFHNESIVSGTVEFGVKTGLFSSIKSVVVELVGTQRTMRGIGVFMLENTGEVVFLTVKKTIWEAGPQHPKLVQGTNRLTFELMFPKTFSSINRKTRNELCDLPPSFSTPGFPFYLLYELRCTIHRGMLQDQQVLSIPIKYVPRKEAAAPSTARMLSYEAHTPIPDPSTDPDGWATFPKERLVRAFGNRDVVISCEFSVATPLQYARGGLIPVHFQVTCADQQTLDLLCTPGAFTLHLKRWFRVGEASTLSETDEGYDPRSKDLVTKGKYWRTNVVGSAGPRTFEGEIGLSGQLMQTFTYPKLALSYAVQLYLTAPGLVMADKGPIASIPVEVTYFAAPGQSPVSYAPPSQTEGDEVQSSYVGIEPPLKFWDH